MGILQAPSDLRSLPAWRARVAAAAEACRRMGFPVFALGVSMRGSTKLLPGRIAMGSAIGDVRIAPGDIVIGDDDGVVVVPREEAQEVLVRARAREAREEALRQALREGKTTVELLGLEPTLRALGLLD